MSESVVCNLRRLLQINARQYRISWNADNNFDDTQSSSKNGMHYGVDKPSKQNVYFTSTYR